MAEGKNLVGVDIGASSIKVVLLRESRKKLQVVRWGWAQLPPQTIIDGHVMNAGAVTETLARVFHEGKDPAARRGHRRLRPERHRSQDHRSDHDPVRARRADSLGGRTAHPIRHQAHVDRLRGAAAQARRPGRWICCSSPPRRTRSTTTQPSCARPSSSPPSSTSTRSPSRTSSSTRTVCPKTARSRFSTWAQRSRRSTSCPRA
jgi:hypothetical protein